MPDTNLNFSERCATLRDAAVKLRDIADIVADEATRMSAAQKRFAERRGQRREKSSR